MPLASQAALLLGLLSCAAFAASPGDDAHVRGLKAPLPTVSRSHSFASAHVAWVRRNDLVHPPAVWCKLNPGGFRCLLPARPAAKFAAGSAQQRRGARQTPPPPPRPCLPPSCCCAALASLLTPPLSGPSLRPCRALRRLSSMRTQVRRLSGLVTCSAAPRSELVAGRAAMSPDPRPLPRPTCRHVAVGLPHRRPVHDTLERDEGRQGGRLERESPLHLLNPAACRCQSNSRMPPPPPVCYVLGHRLPAASA